MRATLFTRYISREREGLFLLRSLARVDETYIYTYGYMGTRSSTPSSFVVFFSFSAAALFVSTYGC